MSTEAPAPADRALLVGRLVLAALAVWALLGLGEHFQLWRRAGFVQTCLSVAAGTLVAFGCTRLGRGPGASQSVVAGLVLVAMASLQVQAGDRLEQFGKPAQLGNWGIYHYYLGSKYFDELGYTELYRETIKADAEGPNKFAGVDRIRNLHMYKTEPAADFRGAPRHPNWTDARWKEFSEDVWYIGGLRRAEDWNKILRDRGYNPPPSYTLFAGALNSLFSVRTPFGQTTLALIDLLVVLLAFAVSVPVYGLRRSLIVLIGYILWFGNWGRIYGQFWINDWFAACWMAVAFMKSERYRWAGALAAYATAMRVFPGVLFVGPVVAAIPTLLRDRRPPPWVVRYVGAGLVTGLLLVAVSGVRYGPSSWVEFAGNITTHSDHHEAGLRRVGLKHLGALDWRNGLERSAVKARPKDMQTNAGLHEAVAGVLLVLLLVGMVRSEPHEAMLLALGIVFLATVASRYYGAVWALWLLMYTQRARGPDSPARDRTWVAMDVAWFAVMFLFYAAPISSKHPRIEYMWGNAGVLAFLLGLIALTAFAPLRPKHPSTT